MTIEDNLHNEDDAKVNLFVYGSLRDSRIFQSVCGLSFSKRPAKVDADTLFAEPALLPQHRRVSPDNVYFYAIASPSSRIEGLLIHNIPTRAMAEIDRYEGLRYKRETVQVNTGRGPVEAQAYLVSHASMARHFGDRFHVNLIHELWLRKRIEKFIKKRTRPGERTVDADLERRAERELLATTERDLVMSHYHSDAVSDYYLEHELDRPRPTIKHLYDDPQAQPFVKNYLTVVVRQVLLNQLDEHIQGRYRFELEHMRSSERYFKRSVSLLIALQMINSNRETVRLIVDECLQRLPYRQNDLIDYVKYAVRAARSMFEARVAQAYLSRIGSNLHPGLVPLGVELELSNLGAAAVEPQRSKQGAADPVYDGFKYFYDFHLDILSWKLGGYIDDHSGATDQGQRRGFLELAPGRLNIAGELSRPATADPWLLGQLIHEIANFYDVRPHSLHLSLQLRKNQLDNQEVLPLSFAKCLLALGGGPEQTGHGRLWVSRMGHDEIKQYQLGEELVFARTSKRRWYLGGDDIANKPPAQATTCVQQYKFIRLDRRANYEPLIMCLKGLQLACNPGDYLTAEQLADNPRLQQQYEELKQWAVEPTEISAQTIGKFVKTVQEGLMSEGHHQPVHKLHYIDWALSAIDVQLRMFNKQLAESSSS
jgi:gamma-glutamylcyclotransferase (GGCT)/AIG2-like uncharacterized protein YtfP